MTLITKGSGLRFIGDTVITFEEGDFVWINPNVPHQWVSSKEVMDVEAYVLQFDPLILNQVPELKNILSAFSQKVSGWDFNNLDKKIKELPIFIHQTNDEPIQKFFKFLDLLYRLKSKTVSEIPLMINSDQQIIGNKRLDTIHKFIFENYQTQIDLETIAKKINMTKTSFCRWFKQAKGISFVNYLHQFRIEQACHLLKTAHLSKSQIAYEVGFESISQFNRTFKKVKNLSPSDFMKEFNKD